jgi:hypothetical protein
MVRSLPLWPYGPLPDSSPTRESSSDLPAMRAAFSAETSSAGSRLLAPQADLFCPQSLGNTKVDGRTRIAGFTFYRMESENCCSHVVAPCRL